jgi:hypothetical protein
MPPLLLRAILRASPVSTPPPQPSGNYGPVNVVGTGMLSSSVR